MLSDYFGCFIWPAQIATERKFYTAGGLIIWRNLDFSCFKFERREYGRDDDNIRAAIRDPDRAVILEVAHSHWVVATGHNWLRGYSIADPWLGDRATMRRYNNRITGAAYFQRSIK